MSAETFSAPPERDGSPDRVRNLTHWVYTFGLMVAKSLSGVREAHQGKCPVRWLLCNAKILFNFYVPISQNGSINDFLIYLFLKLHCQKKYVMSNCKGVN